jgi:peptidoglycan/xylan/chitin deacetylase (PgdA/CDA1 family)
VTRVLLYHDVVADAARDDAGFPGPLAARYKLDPAAFAAHLDAIAATGAEVGLLDNPQRPHVALTFDDGGASAPAVASALEERGWRAYFFVATACMGRPGFLGADELRELDGRGHRVGSHSHSHPTYMASLTPAELDDEWRRSRDILSSLLEREVDIASVPGGFLSPRVVAAAAGAGYTTLMTSEPTLRVRRVRAMDLVGRFAVWERTSATRAAAYARGDTRARSRLWIEWQTKTAAKRLSPRAYQTLRRVRAQL